MTIVCGTDFSPTSITACEVAALIAAAHDEPLLLVHAVMPVTVPPQYDVARALDDVVTSAERALSDLAARLGKDGVQVSTSVPVGAADEVLLAEVEESRRAHDRGRLGGWTRAQSPPRQHQ